RRATLAPPATNIICQIISVPNVTLRGFCILVEKENRFGIAVEGKSPGVVLEDLQLDFRGGHTTGISVEGLIVSPTETPVAVQYCELRRPTVGIRISGVRDDSKTPMPCAGVLVRGNLIDSPDNGIITLGRVQRIHIVANRILGANRALELRHI